MIIIKAINGKRIPIKNVIVKNGLRFISDSIPLDEETILTDVNYCSSKWEKEENYPLKEKYSLYR